MSTCCDTSEAVGTVRGSLVVALAGNPNSGKTTLFNALTGLRQKVANYPGVTVEKKTGRCQLRDGVTAEVIDLPGAYSLISRSPDELVAMEVLRGLRPDTPAPDVVVVVVDASNLQRNLYLVSQMIELGRPMVVALNMMDIAERRGQSVSAEKLSHQLGVPVVAVVGHKKKGIDELKTAILQAKVAAMPEWKLPLEMHREMQALARELEQLDSNSARPIDKSAPSALNEIHSPRQGQLLANAAELKADPSPEQRDRYLALAERLLIGDTARDIEELSRRASVSDLLKAFHARLNSLGLDPMHADIEAHYEWIDRIAGQSMTNGHPVEAREGKTLEYASPRSHLSDRIDRILLHKFWGSIIFVAIMGLLFVSIFTLAGPIMDAFEGSIAWLGDKVVARMDPDTALTALVKDGIFAGVGGVVVFVPQIAILFLFLAILEDSGYLARAAFLMDRLLSKVGLNGKSFIPMLSSFACAIPGIMATRTIENRRERLATIFVAPFMSCSARLPVYGLLIGTFFATYSAFTQGMIQLSMYLIGILAAAGTAWLFKVRSGTQSHSSFILEMPSYKLPQAGQVLRVVYTNTKAFLVKAGTIIFALSIILWAMSYYPHLSPEREAAIRADRAGVEVTDAHREAAAAKLEEEKSPEVSNPQQIQETAVDLAIDEKIGSTQLQESIAGRFGHFIEPVIKPLGFDWKMGVGLVGSFAAREVFVSTMGIVYGATGGEDDTKDLSDHMVADKYANGKPVWTPLVAVSLLVWFVIAMQCMSTLAIVKRETNGWKWPLLMLVYMNGLAWVVCFAIYQVGRIWWA